PPGRFLQPDNVVLEAVLDVVGDVTDLLHPSLEHLIVSLLFVCSTQERQHHLKLVLDEALVLLDAELQSYLLRDGGFGIA
ncbi:Os08g0539800, partial [Oryza sativa Japonica Group]